MPTDRIETITFDCYGTLIDWKLGFQRSSEIVLAGRFPPGTIHELWREWLQIQTMFCQGPYKPYHKIIADSFDEAIRRKGWEHQPRDGERLAFQFPTWPAFADVKSVLLDLQGRVKVFIISNTDDEILSNSILKIGIGFDGTMTAGRAKCYKPNPVIFRRAIETLSLDPETNLHVACRETTDLVPARQMGFRTAWLKRGDAQLISTFQPDFVLNKMDDLLTLKPLS